MAINDYEQPKRLTQRMFANAKLYYDREDFLVDETPVNSYLEIGVLAGDYSDLVLKYLNPKIADLVDTYDQPDWNRIAEPRFDKNSHYEYMKNKYSKINGVNIIKSAFKNNLPEIDKRYDFIYIDADHSREFTDNVLEFSKAHIVVGGIVGVNDYMIVDHFYDKYYGTVQSVNEFLCTNRNWEVHAYVLGVGGHPDIYIKKMS